MSWTKTSIVLSLLFIPIPLFGYAKDVHREITGQALIMVQNQVQFEEKIGADLSNSVLGKMLGGWCRDGAYAQDSGVMFMNHFMDVQNEQRALTVKTLGCNTGWLNARDWALVHSPYSLMKARTLYEIAVMHPNESQRQKFLASLFHYLGHAVHLVQDMAQPEHARNDPHLPGWLPYLGGEPSGAPWEDWSANFLLNDASISFYEGYPPVELSTYGSYFHSEEGQGMADFSATNYVTQHTNYDDQNAGTNCLPHPVPSLEQAVPFDVYEDAWVLSDAGEYYPVGIEKRIYQSVVWDAYLGKTEIDHHHTVYSAIDFELDKWAGKKVYSLSKESYVSRAKELTKRSVGYSAGLIKHFFRGEISAEWSDGSSPGSFNLKIVNTSDETIGPGTKLIAAYRPGEEYLGGSEDLAIIDQIMIGALPPGGSALIQDLSIPGLKAGDEVDDFETRIVLRGPLGQEEDDVISLIVPGDGGEDDDDVIIVEKWLNWDGYESKPTDDGGVWAEYAGLWMGGYVVNSSYFGNGTSVFVSGPACYDCSWLTINFTQQQSLRFPARNLTFEIYSFPTMDTWYTVQYYTDDDENWWRYGSPAKKEYHFLPAGSAPKTITAPLAEVWGLKVGASRWAIMDNVSWEIAVPIGD